jgi:hypothetical protein
VKQLVDAFSIANTVRMVRSKKRYQTAVLVEGYKDVRLYLNLFDDSLCFVTPAITKMSAVGALRQLRKSGVPGVVAIIDTDFTVIEGRPFDDPDILTTDTHDVEGILLKSPALEKVMVEHTDKLNAFGSDLRGQLLTATRPVGYLRLASDRGGYMINFSQFDFARFISPDNLACDLKLMTGEAVVKSTNSRIPATRMLEEIKDLDNAHHDPWMISCGHDLTSTLAVALSSRSSSPVFSYTVERQLRLAYEKAFFLDTALRKKIVEWEVRNLPFRMLRA